MFAGQGNGPAFGWAFQKQMYDIWVRTTTELLEEMMKTSAFAGTMGRSVDQSLDFKRQVDEALEAWLKSLRFATESDMQAVLSVLKSIEGKVDRLAAPGTERIEQVLQTQDFAANLGRNLSQSLDFRRQLAEVVTAIRDLEAKVIQTTSEIRAYGPKLGETIALFRQTMETVTTLLNRVNETVTSSLKGAAEGTRTDTQAVLTELRAFESKVVQIASVTTDAIDLVRKQTAVAANLGKGFPPSADLKRQVEEALEEWLGRTHLATKSDLESVLTTVETAEGKVVQITSSMGAFATNLGKALDQLRQADENLAASLKAHEVGIESEIQAVRMELKGGQRDLALTNSLVKDMVGWLDAIAKKLDQLIERSASNK